MNEKILKKALLRVFFNIFVLAISMVLCFYLGFISRSYLQLTYYPMEHCFLQGDKMECYLDPCEMNCNYSYNWEDYKNEKGMVCP